MLLIIFVCIVPTTYKCDTYYHVQILQSGARCGIAEMAGMSHKIRERTDALDAAGNTTADIGKVFSFQVLYFLIK